MAVTKLLNLLAISCLAIIASFGPVPVSALSVETVHHARRDHHVLAAKKRGNSTKRCKPRSPAPAPSPAPTSSKEPAPKPSTSQAVSQPSPTSSGGGGNNNGARKVGIAWAGGDDTGITQFWSWKTQYYYTWSPWCIDAADKVGFQCCRMLWGSKQIDDFTKNARPGNGNCAMGMNEPNEPSQSNMSPQDAAGLWKQYMEPLKDHGYTLVSPACTNGPSGKAWMQDFFKACDGCRVDVMALHFYGTNAEDFISYVKDSHNTFGKKVWVTEYACNSFSGGKQCSQQEAVDFMKAVTSFMDGADYVTQYFAFGALTDMGNVNPVNQLLNPSGKGLTALGELYIGN